MMSAKGPIGLYRQSPMTNRCPEAKPTDVIEPISVSITGCCNALALS